MESNRQDRGRDNERRNGDGRASDGMAEVAIRGVAMLLDWQLDTARSVWRAQARAASMLGAPDYSDLFRIEDDRAEQIFSASAEQLVRSTRHARDVVVEVQRQIGRLAEQQAIRIAEEARRQAQRIEQRSEQGLREIEQATATLVDQAATEAGASRSEERTRARRTA